MSSTYTLPPTFLRTTLLTNEIRGNVTVKGGVIIQSNGNAYVIGNTSIITGIGQSALPTNVLGNITGVYANVNTVNASNVNATHISASNVIATGNVEAAYFLGNGALLSGIEQYVLPSEITADVLGNVTATGNVEAAFFIGNGALLTGVSAASLPDVIAADILGNVTATGNVSANYFLGNGAMLSDVAVLNSAGMIRQTNLDGYLTVPQGYVANAADRLALGGGSLPVGSLVRQVNDGNSYLLTLQPSNVDANWLEFTGLNFPVNTVFGRVGDISSSFGDYTDEYIELSANVGPVPAGNSLVEALGYLNSDTRSIVASNVTANVIFSSQMPFMWSAMINENPVSGTNLITPGVLSGNAYFITAVPWDGVHLNSFTAGTAGMASWNVPYFDFTKNFAFEASVFAENIDESTYPDGQLWFSIGGASQLTTTPALNTTGSLTLGYNENLGQNFGNSQFRSNSSQIGFAVRMRAGVRYFNKWVITRLEFRTINGRRYAMLFTDTSTLDNAVDITDWSPAGAWISVGGYAGVSADLGQHFVNNVSLTYI